MNRTLILLAACICGSAVFLNGQDPAGPPTPPPTGLSLQYGAGRYAMRDEYISKERYAGTLPTISADWSRFHDKWGYRVRLEMRFSEEIKNHNVSADVLQAALQHDYLYPVGQVGLFGKEAQVYAGPSFGLYLYLNNQNIAAQGALHADMSLAMLLFLGLNTDVVIPLGSRLLVEGSGRASLLSFTVRNTDPVEEDGVAVGLLTILSGTMLTADAGVRYRIQDKLSIKAAGMLQILSISKWTPLLAVSDNITLTLSYHL
ncbi:hypothetical protein ACFL6Q_02660 [Candidatus Neomarinimicrobiota bacterium]